MDLNVRLIYRLIPRTHGLLESYIFFKSHFSPEWDSQPAFKLNMDVDVRLIYRLIPRTHGFFLSILPLLLPLQSVAFLGASFSVHDCIRHENTCFLVSVDWYALYRFACKIRGWVAYLVPEKKATLSKKKGGVKIIHFRKKVPMFKNILIPDKAPLFLHLHFLVNGMDNLLSNLTWT
jgi:hypothetical protein